MGGPGAGADEVEDLEGGHAAEDAGPSSGVGTGSRGVQSSGGAAEEQRAPPSTARKAKR